jgi:O-antigen/teichoic acid export membrane protein
MSLARGIAITALGNFIPPVAALAAQPILAHSLGVAGRGEVAAATAPVLLGVVVLGLGIPESLTHFAARRARMRRTLSSSVAVLTLSGVIGIALTASFAGQLSGHNRELATLMIVATSSLIPALFVSGMRGLAAGRQAWTIIAIERGISATLRLAAVAILAAAGKLDVLSATVAISSTTFIGGIVYLFLGRVTTSREISEENPVRRLPSFPLYAAQIWIGAAAGILYSRLDQLLITPLAGVYELGLYAVAASVAEVILLINLSIRDVIFAVESENPNDRRAAQAARISTLITGVLGGVFAIMAPWVVPTLFGAAFKDAVLLTALLILAAICGNPGSVAGAVLSGRGRPGLRSLSLAIGVIVNLAGVILLVPHFGAIGAALATLIASIAAGNNLNILWLRLFYKLPMSDYLVIRLDDLRMAGDIIKRMLKIRR